MAVELKDIVVDVGEHVVQFYDRDAQLVGTVGRYLAGALQDGAVAIVIATGDHRQGLEAQFEIAGLDPARRGGDGSLILLDAAQTMSGFVHDGRVDDEDFRRVVGSVVCRAAESGRPVMAYGEMVALLWEAGNVPGAIELEKSWNLLAGEVPFGLVCGYRRDAVQGAECREALEQICHLHSSVRDAPASEEDDAAPVAHFALKLTAPRSARQFVAEALKRWGHPTTLIHDAQLVVTELATNAVVHARSPFSVAVRRHGDGVRLSVRDASQTRPIAREPGPLTISGRGLYLVGLLSRRWGVEPDADGKTVWAELPG